MRYAHLLKGVVRAYLYAGEKNFNIIKYSLRCYSMNIYPVFFIFYLSTLGYDTSPHGIWEILIFVRIVLTIQNLVFTAKFP